MNRNEEYLGLLEALDAEGVPAALDDCVDRAVKKAHRRSRRRDWSAALVSLGGIAAAFALAVNLSVPFAMACKRVPVLKDLAAAVALSPSLKAAVENDYIQYVGQEQTANGVTLGLDYLILDQRQINFFCTVSGGEYESFFVHPHLARADGGEMTGYGLSSANFRPGELGGFSATFEQGAILPEEIVLTCQVIGHRRTSDVPAIPLDVPAASHYDVEPEAVGSFTFPLTLDTHLMEPGRSIEVNAWVEIDAQRLCIQRLEVAPTQARLIVTSDPDNTAWCTGLSFYLADGEGRRYETGSWASSGSSLVSSGDDQNNGSVTYFLESPYFSASRDLTLYITAARWLEKDPEKRLELDHSRSTQLDEPLAVEID